MNTPQLDNLAIDQRPTPSAEPRHVEHHERPAPSAQSRLCAALIAVLLSIGALAAQGNDYVVGAQDVLTIQVFDQADLGGKYSVETDGSISFPLIGRVNVSGLTLREVELRLKKELSNGFFRNPQVSVAVEQYRSQRIFIVGEVRNPGAYALTGDMTLIEALAKAGSTTDGARGEAIIVRPTEGQVAEGPLMPETDNTSDVVHVDIRQLQEGKLSQNLALRDGDTIFVPKAEALYVFGQVKNPGAYAVQKDTTVLQALSLAGGVTDRGATGRIKIVRIVSGKRVELKAKLTDRVQPGDTIIVPERFF